MRNVHIVTVDFDPHPSLEMLASGDVDHVYLLNDRTEERAVKSEKKIRRILDDIGTISYEVVEVDCYDYQNVHDKIIQIAEGERDNDSRCQIHINFSRGTAIAVGAACTAACVINGADLYYSKWRKGDTSDTSNRIIHVDTSEFAVIFRLKGSTKDVFKQFGKAKGEQMNNSDLISYSGLERNSLTYHTKKLVNMGLIEKMMDGRNASWHVTETGKKVLKRILR